MDSPYSVLGISPYATRSEIESAYRDKRRYWNDLRSVPNRAAEAAEMLNQLEFARDQTLDAINQQGDGLVDPSSRPMNHSEADLFPATGGNVGAKDSDVCPQCGQREDSPEAVYCTNKACRFELKPCCPGCSKRIAWYKEICPYCGIDIEARNEVIRLQIEKDRLQREADRYAEIQELDRRLHKMKQDLACVQASSRLTSGSSQSRLMMERYGVSSKNINVGRVLASLAGAFGFAFAIAAGPWLLVAPSGHIWGLLTPIVLPTAVIFSLFAIAVLAVNATRGKTNQRATEQEIQRQIGEVKQQLRFLQQ